MMYGIDEFDEAKVQNFITNHTLYNIRSPKSFNTLLNSMKRLRVDGLSTRQNKWHPRAYDNIYDQSSGLFIIEGEPFKVNFTQVKKSRYNFYYDEEGQLMLIFIFEISIGDSLDNSIFDDIRSNGKSLTYFSFAINIKMTDVDTMAAKMCDS